MPYKVLFSDSLSHHGILGQKWGVRRYQNRDGTLTEAGKKRYAKDLTNSFKNASSRNEAVTSAKKMLTTNPVYAAQIENLSRLGDEQDSAYERYEKLGGDYYESEQYYKDMDQAYEDCLNWYKQNEPEYLKSIVSQNGGKTSGLYKFPDFDDTYDEFLDRAWFDGLDSYYNNRPELKQAKEDYDKAWSKYLVEAKKLTKSIIGSYGDTEMRGYQYATGMVDTARDITGEAVRQLANRKVG